MTKMHVSLLVLTFFLAMLMQPNWAYENFWSKADFYDLIPFRVPFLAFLLIYSLIVTALAELSIRFIKRYA